MKAFLIKITGAALNLSNAIVSSLWALILAGFIWVAFGILSDDGAALRHLSSVASLIPVMGTYILSSVCLRHMLLGGCERGFSAVLVLGAVIFFIGHLSLVMGLGMYIGHAVFQPEGQALNGLHASLGFQGKVLGLAVFGALSCVLGLLPCFTLYAVARKIQSGKTAPAPYMSPPSFLEGMFSKQALITSVILSAVIIFLTVIIGW